jgi:flagellar hook protein FlgE
MYTSISGLRNHQLMLDNTANNIGNVNTYGFKASSVTFKDLLSQTLQGASAPTASLGGTNNRQVGLGMTVDSITQRHTQGGLATTGVKTDLAISGDGFFRLSNDRAGLTAVPPTNVTLYGRAGNFALDGNGDLVTQDGYYVIGYAELAPPGSGVPDPATQVVINIPPGTTSDWSIGQDGRVTRMDTTTGTLTTVGWVTMSKFANPSGLTQVGDNRWSESVNSGVPVDDIPASTASGMGKLQAGTLEMSNVDLATEFTEMIRAQRGFQANSRVITTSDEILQELVNLKR